MPQISFQVQGREQETHELTGNVVSIGARRDNKIQVRDHVVSGHHGQFIQNEHGGYHYVDLGSTNGSFFEGRKISEVDLEDGNTLMLGNIACTYREDVRSPRSKRLPKPPILLPKSPSSN